MPYIDSTDPVASGAQQPATGLGDLDSDAFLQLLVAQMRYQDPMSPTDHTAMLQQTSQFTQVETMQQVSALQQQILGLSQAAMASELVGKEVSAETAEGGEVTGLVEAVRFTSEGPVLQVGDHELPLQAATEIRLPGSSSTAGVAPMAAAEGTEPQEAWSGPWFHDAGDSHD